MRYCQKIGKSVPNSDDYDVIRSEIDMEQGSYATLKMTYAAP